MVLLRKLTMEDADTTFAYSSDFENTYYMLNSPFLTIEETKRFLAKCIAEYDCQEPRYLSFAVTYNEIHVGEVFASIAEKEADASLIYPKDLSYAILNLGANYYFINNGANISHSELPIS